MIVMTAQPILIKRSIIFSQSYRMYVLLVSHKWTYVLESVPEPVMKNKPIYKGMPSMRDKRFH